jgi:1-deoxy-D-xylulose-5-phosphate synthase
VLGVVPGVKIAAPRDEASLRLLFREAVACSDGPTVIRFPKTPLGEDVATVRRVGGVDVLAEPAPDQPVDVLVVTFGAMAADLLDAVSAVRQAGFTVRVVDPGWVTPVDPTLIDLARNASLVVTAEDGVVAGGAGSRLAQALGAAAVDVPVRHLGVPVEFPRHGKVSDVRAWAGLAVPDLGRRIVEWAVAVVPDADQPAPSSESDAPTRRRDARA